MYRLKFLNHLEWLQLCFYSSVCYTKPAHPWGAWIAPSSAQTLCFVEVLTSRGTSFSKPLCSYFLEVLKCLQLYSEHFISYHLPAAGIFPFFTDEMYPISTALISAALPRNEMHHIADKTCVDTLRSDLLI